MRSHDEVMWLQHYKIYSEINQKTLKTWKVRPKKLSTERFINSKA